MPIFDSLYNSNIEIIDIMYSLSLKITRNIDITDIAGCISSLFNVEQSNLKKGISMRFKRVTNYSEMDSLEAFILDQYKKKT